MALTRKAGPAQAVSLIGQIPDLPTLPKEVLDRFGSMEIYAGQMKQWWSDFQDMLQRDRGQVQAQFNADEATTASSLKTLQAEIDTINATLTALASSSTGPTQAQFQALSNSFSALSDLVAAHIAANVAHGTASPIVGTVDAQDIERKRIGISSPGYGRFAPAVGYGYIPGGQTVNIGFQDFMIVAGTFTVDGTLNIAGTLVAL